MKYCVTARPGVMPPSPEQFDAALEWLRIRLDDGTFDCLYGFLEGGGFSVANVASHSEVLELMTEYPLYGMVEWDIRPVLEFGEGTDTIRAKLVEAQAMVGG
ncbi:MAG TPA: hypothetical protein VH299_08000 [Solirubrobacterales bacterium]|jgi:hypothetical protein|nr:hypothetical protein [Solirubrobacterales bacterium]